MFAGMFRVFSSVNPLCLINRGKVMACGESGRMHVVHRLGLTQVLIVSICAAAFLTVVGAASGFTPRSLVVGDWIVFLYFYGDNYVFARCAVAGIIRKCWKRCCEQNACIPSPPDSQLLRDATV